jgi:hypothetical protein
MNSVIVNNVSKEIGNNKEQVMNTIDVLIKKLNNLRQVIEENGTPSQFDLNLAKNLWYDVYDGSKDRIWLMNKYEVLKEI